jgi:hypothetical protein
MLRSWLNLSGLWELICCLQLTPRSREEVMGLLELCNTAIARNIGHDDYTSREGGIYASVSGTSMYTQSTDMSRLQGESPLHTGKYLKSRYAPFWSVLSLASRVTTGHEVYWDMFRECAFPGPRLEELTSCYPRQMSLPASSRFSLNIYLLCLRPSLPAGFIDPNRQLNRPENRIEPVPCQDYRRRYIR